MSISTAWQMTAAAWFVLLVIFIVVGTQQTRVTHGSVWRLVWVSMFLATLGVLPAVLISLVPPAGPTAQDKFVVVVQSAVFNLFVLSLSLRPPVIMLGSRQQLPEVHDEGLLQRISGMDAKMRIPVPMTRLWPSVSGAQPALAYAGTLQAPQIVVTDGIINRLSPHECDAIVGHELGHLANRSLFVLTSLLPISSAVMTGSMNWLPISSALPFGLAFYVGLRSIVSRPIEFDCDLRAARANGFAVTVSALRKIHAVLPIPNTGILSLLIYATATHPSRDARLAALCRKAPHGDHPDFDSNQRPLLRVQSRLATVAFVIWILGLTGPFLAIQFGLPDGVFAATLWAIAAAPQVLILFAARRYSQTLRRRMGNRWGLHSILGITLVSTVAAIFLLKLLISLIETWTGQPAAEFILILPLLAAISFFLWWLFGNRRRRLEREIAVEFQLHHFDRIIQLCHRSPKIVHSSHTLRYHLAVAKALSGDRESAIQNLEQLWVDKPRFPLAALTLGELLLDSHQAERAIEIANQVAVQLPRDVAVPMLKGRALRRLGRLDDAEAACDQGFAIESNGALWILVAAIALDRNEVTHAQSCIQLGLSACPGDCYGLVVQAEIAGKSEPAAKAKELISGAILAIRRNPLALLESEIRRLEATLEAC
jgi:Zn-dependent protease with chaperone function/tetratricopeptide (TPR) repeat protein